MKRGAPKTADPVKGGLNVVIGVMIMLLIALLALGQRAQLGMNQAAAIAIGEPVFSGTTVSVLLLLILILAGAFVAGETAMDVLRPIHARHGKEFGDGLSRILLDLHENKARYMSACIFGRQLTHLGLIFGSFILGQGLAGSFVEQFGWPADFRSILLASLVVVVPVELVNLIVGQLVPKSFASVRPHRVAQALYPFIRLSAGVFGLFTWLLSTLANLITAHFGAKASFSSPTQAEDEIRNLVESAEETGEIERDEKELIHSVFEFSDTIAREIMTPRVDLDALSVTADAITAVKMIETTGHSRIPLFEETDDQIVGIVHAKDLLMAIAAGKKVTLRGIMRQPLFVPENKNLHELLGEMRNSRSQFAIVQDEFGGTAGIVTIEDIVEELVGDIVDEYDNEEPSFQKVDDGWLVDGKTHWNDVNHEIGSEFDSEEFDTIGGYVFGLFGRQPVLAETIEEAEHRFTVTKTDGRRILQLRIEKVSAESADDSLELSREGS